MNRSITIVDSRRNQTSRAYQVLEFQDGSAGVEEPFQISRHPIFRDVQTAIDYVMELLNK